MSTSQWMLTWKRRLSRLWSAALAHWIVLEERARPHLRRVRACERPSASGLKVWVLTAVCYGMAFAVYVSMLIIGWGMLQ